MLKGVDNIGFFSRKKKKEPEQQTDQQAEPPKSKMKMLNEETRELQKGTSDDDLKGIKVMKGVFNGYKIGDEDGFLNEAEPEEEESKVDKGLDVADTGSKTSGFLEGTIDLMNKKVGDWKEGNGIVGAALTIISNVKSAYNAWKDRGKEKKEEEKGDAAVSFVSKTIDTVEAIFKIIDAAGGAVKTVLKVIPGVTFIFDAIDIAKATVKIIKSDISRVRMNNSRRLFKEKYLNRTIPSEDESQESQKKMVKKVKWYNVRRFWKKTDITFDEDIMKSRRDFLLEKRKQAGELPPDLEEELRDIIKFLVQDRLRRLRRNDEFKGAGKIVLTLGKVAGKIASFGASSAAELVADTTDYALNAVDLGSMAGEYTIGKYQKRGGRNKGQQYTRYLLELIGSLPESYDEDKDKMEYKQTLDMVLGTGVDSEEVYKVSKKAETEETNKNKAAAYNMFIDLFEG